MKKAAKKGVEKAVTAAATKTGEYAGKKAGDKIVQLLSKGSSQNPPAGGIASPQNPPAKKISQQEIDQMLNNLLSTRKRKLYNY